MNTEWDIEWYDFGRRAVNRRRHDGPDETGVYPSHMQYVLKSRKPYSYEEFYLHNTRRKYNAVDYSDRLVEWDYDKYNKCCQEVWGDQGQWFDSRRPEEIEKFLQLYHNEPKIKLAAIIEGCNVSSGYPYWVFRYNHPSC